MVNFLPIVKTLETINISVRGLGQVVVDPATIVVGNNSVVARCRIDGVRGFRTIKCYVVPQDAREMVPMSFYPQSLRVYTFSGVVKYVDVAICKWITGVALDEVLHRGGCDYKVLSRVFDRMALKHLKKGLIHGDIKPENIIVTPSGNMMLIDTDCAPTETRGRYHPKDYGSEIFRHRLRCLRRTDKSTDDYAIALLSSYFAASVFDHNLYSHQCSKTEAIQLFANILKENGDIAHYNLVVAMQRSIMGKVDNILTLMQEIVEQAQAEDMEP